MNADGTLAALARLDPDESSLPPAGVRRRPCQACDEVVDVVGGVAVDPHHRFGRCHLEADLEAGHAAAVAEMEAAAGTVSPFTVRF